MGSVDADGRINVVRVGLDHLQITYIFYRDYRICPMCWSIKIGHSEVQIDLLIVICSFYKWTSQVFQEMAKRGLLANIFHRSDPNDRDQLRIQEEKVEAKVLK